MDIKDDMLTINNEITILSYVIKQNVIDWKKLIYMACKDGSLIIVKLVIENAPSLTNYGLYNACKYNYIDIIIFLINKGASNWNKGLRGACEGGHITIVKLMIEKGAINWNWGLRGACEGGHIEIVKLMIEKGASDWNYGLYYSCEGGHIEIVKLMIEQGADDWKEGLYYACNEGHIEVVKLMIKKGANVINIHYFDKITILNTGINHNTVIHDTDYKNLIYKRENYVDAFNTIADAILHELYKDKQMYDKNILDIVSTYIP